MGQILEAPARKNVLFYLADCSRGNRLITCAKSNRKEKNVGVARTVNLKNANF